MVEIYEKKITVGPESIDVLGHVNNREYFRWMEEVACEHADILGWGLKTCQARKEAWVAREHWVEFLRPTFEGDVLTIYTWVEKNHGSRCFRRYAMKKDRKIACSAATEWAYISLVTGHALDIPKEVCEGFPAVPQDDPRLVELGIARPVRFRPEWL